MLFSVIIPTHNRLPLLQRALSSVRGQSYSNFEVVVVDDGSTDATLEWLGSQDQTVRILRQTNRGPGAARNVGVQRACGDYVAFLDSDDLWFPWTLEVFAEAIQRHRQPHILSGEYVEFRDETELLALREQSVETDWFADYLSSSHHSYAVGSGTCVLRRDCFAHASFLEDRLNAEDHDLTLQLGTVAGFVRISSPVTVAWRRHSASETGNLASTTDGAARLSAREKSGAYPGGRKRSRERRRILTRHTRPATLDSLRAGLRREAWDLYISTFGWNASLGRARYLTGFLLLAAATAFRGAAAQHLRGRPSV